MQKYLLDNFDFKKSCKTLKFLYFFVLLFGLKTNIFAQAGSVGIGTNLPSSNAILDINSTTKGVLLPRLSQAQRTTLTPLLNLATNGLLIYNVTTLRFNYWNGTQWNDVGLAGANGADKREVVNAVSFNIAQNSALIQTYPFAGAVVGNAVVFSPNFVLADGLIISYARVSAPDVIEVKFYNATGIPIINPSGNYQIAIVK